MQYIFFLGHQPHLSLAELEARFGTNSIQASTNSYAVLKLSSDPNINLLGGTTKISKIIQTQKLEQNTQQQIKEVILNYLAEQKNEKLKLGISIYSATKNINPNKKFIRELSEEIRQASKTRLPKLNLHTVDPKSTELNTAQIIHSGLLKTNGLSLDILVEDRSPNPHLRHPRESGDPVNSTDESQSIILAKTIQVPNLKNYTLRDYGKPKPSGSNGMLPPKLTQILLNLSQVKPGQTILDPFCGSGTVLQEALLAGINAIGTDLNPKIIKDAEENLTWLERKFPLPLREGARVRVYQADATSSTWPEPFDAIVCEGYLGTPLSSEPDQVKLSKITQECNQIAEQFLINLHSQINQNQTVVIALPCWFIQDKIIKLPVVEKLTALGYNQRKSKIVTVDLIYRRTSEKRNQIVGRDIYVLNKSN